MKNDPRIRPKPFYPAPQIRVVFTRHHTVGSVMQRRKAKKPAYRRKQGINITMSYFNFVSFMVFSPEPQIHLRQQTGVELATSYIREFYKVFMPDKNHLPVILMYKKLRTLTDKMHNIITFNKYLE